MTAAKPAPPRPLYVRVTRAPEMFGISRPTVYRLAKKGLITIHKRGGLSLLEVQEVEAYIKGSAA